MNGLKKKFRSLGHLIGRRGAFLLFLVVLDMCYGIALIRAQVRALSGDPDFFLPLHVWGWIWLGVGVFLLTGVFTRKDIFQYAVAALIKAVWAVLYADLWFVQHQRDAWISIIVWLAFSMTVLVIAGWPEPQVARDYLKVTNGYSKVDTEAVVEDALRDTKNVLGGDGE